MIRQLAISIFLIFGFINTNAQKIGEEYYAIPTDNGQRFLLKFLSDSTLEIKREQRHLFPSITHIYTYKDQDTIISILPDKEIQTDSLGLKIDILEVFALFKKITTLSKIKDGFIDYNSKLIYVKKREFDKNPDFLFIIEGKEFSYSERDLIINGKLYKQREYSKILRKRLKKYNSNNCILTTLKGLNAYYKYGLRGVFGTFILTKKK